MNGPSPSRRHPLEGTGRVGFLKNFITRPNIEIGDYTYYDDPRGPERFEENVLYHFDFVGDRLIIGRFCSIAAGNPAQLVRHRFDEPTRHALLEIAWWDWDAGKLTRNVRAICAADLDTLRAAR